MRLIGTWLQRAVDSPDDLEARGGMLTGSCLAGVSFLKGLGLVHAISHMVGAEYDTHHGLTNAVVLPAVLRFNADSISGRVPQMARALGLEQTSFAAFYAATCELLDALDVPKTLSEIGVSTDSDAVARLAEKAAQDIGVGTNPRSANAVEIRSIINEALELGR